MKFGQFISYPQKNNFNKKFIKTAAWKLVQGPFVFPKHCTTSIRK